MKNQIKYASILGFTFFIFANCSTSVQYSKNPIRANLLEVYLGETGYLSGSDSKNQNLLSVDCRIKSLSSKPLVLKQILGKDKIISNELQKTNTGIYLLPGKEVYIHSCATVKKQEGVELNVVYEELPTLRFETFITEIKKDD